MDKIELDEAQALVNDKASPLVQRDIGLIKHVVVQLVVELGSAEMTVDELFALKAGDVVKLLEKVNEPASLCLDGKVVARGELVAVDDNFGLQLTEIS
ncbi:FliM/FliN family flagellar motor switch protein [Pseudomonas otitidis]|uniref:FliM/FliN family flagellar motor switch protein n=1 Tax=Metapseudomonas otitidis TaxID=319939 RepID=UPI0024489FA0|nr:FliM/FliN family flagellar motor switch protein [Pseudomonas otitidis]MDH1108453.1 FliM/FliN family flagellar motor switch protein [Pseudomonas otitidis]MDH1160916.1 FliM/FliN family flagellar motor switch protein [Pseudomonas otitidis]MDH1167186.1 FliM/FliN family flagellar motor switch protein [Pseudomonas otitidis]